MKKVSEWDEEYIYNIPPGEHDWIEFKGRRMLDLSLDNVDSNKVLDEMSKQISAFANSGGGFLIYGIKDTQINKPREVDDSGVYLKIKNDTKEWLEDIIPNLVEMELIEFNVYVLIKKNNDSNIGDERGIFIIEIRDSDQAPHQARDKRYYARVGGKSRPISHKLVSDIFGRMKNPKIKPTLLFHKFELDNSSVLTIHCLNIGKIYANYINGFVRIPSFLVSTEDHEITEIDGKEYREFYFSNIHKDLVNYKSGMPSLGSYSSRTLDQSYYITRYEPVLPNLAVSETFILVNPIEDLNTTKDDMIYWEIYADNAQVEKGKIKIEDIKIL